MKTLRRIFGGPERRAFGKKDVVPTCFTETDHFWDIGPICNGLDEDVRAGKIKDLIIVTRTEFGVNYNWRGESPMTTVLGMMEYVKDMILAGTR